MPGTVVAGKELGGFACGSVFLEDFGSLSLLAGLQVEESAEIDWRHWVAEL